MQNIEKKLRMLGFILLILLAAFGASMGAGLPFLPKKKDDSNEIKIEQPLSENNTDETKSKEVKP